MNFRLSKLGTIYCLIYFSLFLAALMLAKLYIKETPFASIYIFILTFPWSYIVNILSFEVDLIDSISTNIKLMMFVFYAIINATIIYYICCNYEKRRNKQKAKNEAPINK